MKKLSLREFAIVLVIVAIFFVVGYEIGLLASASTSSGIEWIISACVVACLAVTFGAYTYLSR